MLERVRGAAEDRLSPFTPAAAANRMGDFLAVVEKQPFSKQGAVVAAVRNAVLPQDPLKRKDWHECLSLKVAQHAEKFRSEQRSVRAEIARYLRGRVVDGVVKPEPELSFEPVERSKPVEPPRVGGQHEPPESTEVEILLME